MVSVDAHRMRGKSPQMTMSMHIRLLNGCMAYATTPCACPESTSNAGSCSVRSPAYKTMKACLVPETLAGFLPACDLEAHQQCNRDREGADQDREDHEWSCREVVAQEDELEHAGDDELGDELTQTHHFKDSVVERPDRGHHDGCDND